MTNYKQVFAIQRKNRNKILEVCPRADDISGIYVFYRVDELGVKYAYIGQAKKVLARLAQHLIGYQHIDLSIKKHGFISADNPYGYKIDIVYCAEEQLNKLEREYILEYSEHGYQLRNKTAGSQDVGKQGIDNNRPAKGYRDGVNYGYEKARKEVKALFDKYLSFSTKNSFPNRYELRAVEKFEEWLKNEQVR